MPREEWFRHADWNPEIEKEFFSRWARSKKKAQYVRIQALTLSPTRPEVALNLLEKYFELGDHFDDASAFSHQADAYLALGQFDSALDSLEHGLDRESEYPNVRTEARFDYPFLVATSKRRERYERALMV